MRASILFCLTALSSLLSGMSAAADDAATSDCVLTDQQSVYAVAMDQQVTLITEMSGEAGLLPGADFKLVLSDGQTIDLGSGGKFIDQDGMPCDMHLKEATSPITNSLGGQGVFFDSQEIVDMRSFDKLLRTCKPMEKPADDWMVDVFEKSREARSWQSNYLNCEPIVWMMEMGADFSKTDIDTFDRLLSVNAPLIAVPYSAYGWNIMALDLENAKAVELFYSGC